jgi:class 3 adenylate cyclase
LAVAAGVRIIDRMRAPDRPGVHASVQHGHAIPREGDYFGSVVNLTARLLGAAGRDEQIATRPVVEHWPDLTWRPVELTACEESMRRSRCSTCRRRRASRQQGALARPEHNDDRACCP